MGSSFGAVLSGRRQRIIAEFLHKLHSTPQDPFRSPLRGRSIARAGGSEAHRSHELAAKLDVSAGCAQCHAIAPGDSGHEAVEHSAKCWERIEDLVKKEQVLEDRMEVAEGRRIHFVADCIEEEDWKRLRAEGP